MELPNYENGSIVNLMSSIKKSFGGESPYQPLADFDMSSLGGKNVVLIILDGLGYEYLLKYGKGSFLHENLRCKITSVFPATTAAAITSFYTGLAPGEHGLTGWFMYLKEIGSIVKILPFVSRSGDLDLAKGNVKYEDVYDEKSFFEDLNANSFLITHKDYVKSKYSTLASKGAKSLFFSGKSGFFKQIQKTLEIESERKFVVAYWPDFDSTCHKKGTASADAKKHFDWLDKKMKLLAKSLKDKNAVILVTADHGLIDTREKEKIILLKNHPKFVETLSMPLSGEPRAAYCYVKPSMVSQFEEYVKTHFKDVCEMHKSQELIEKKYFGLREPNEKLKDRIGDYVLVMKENYLMKDFVLGEKENVFAANHGGTSKEEMFVPLVVIE